MAADREVVAVAPSGAATPEPGAGIGLKLVVGRDLGAVVVTLHGALDSATCAALGDVLGDLIDGQGNLFVVVDLLRVDIAQTQALGVLVAARRAVEGRGGRLLLVARSDGGDALRAAGLADLIEVHRERRHHPSTATGTAP